MPHILHMFLEFCNNKTTILHILHMFLAFCNNKTTIPHILHMFLVPCNNKTTMPRILHMFLVPCNNKTTMPRILHMFLVFCNNNAPHIAYVFGFLQQQNNNAPNITPQVTGHSGRQRQCNRKKARSAFDGGQPPVAIVFVSKRFVCAAQQRLMRRQRLLFGDTRRQALQALIWGTGGTNGEMNWGKSSAWGKNVWYLGWWNEWIVSIKLRERNT